MGDIREIDKGIQNTTMAIRETIMQYYKGTCVDRLTQRNRVSVVSYESAADMGRRHNYERHNAQLRDAQMVIIDCWPFLSLEKMPKAVTFHSLVTDRSPEFREIRSRLEKFFAEYLPKVAVKENTSEWVEPNIGYRLQSELTDDSGLVTSLPERTGMVFREYTVSQSAFSVDYSALSDFYTSRGFTSGL